jgi:hypothetical protein
MDNKKFNKCLIAKFYLNAVRRMAYKRKADIYCKTSGTKPAQSRSKINHKA